LAIYRNFGRLSSALCVCGGLLCETALQLHVNVGHKQHAQRGFT